MVAPQVVQTIHPWEYRNSTRVEREGVGMKDCRGFSIFSEVAWHRASASELASVNGMPFTGGYQNVS